MENAILDSAWGVFRYLLYRNDYSWDLLSEREKEIIREANKSHNNIRPDYFDPKKYNGGVCYDSNTNRLDSWRGQYLQDFLEAKKPKAILELGPGSGYYTRQLVEFSSVKRYLGVDINENFLNFLQFRLKDLSQKKDLEFTLMNPERLREEMPKVDAIFLLSMVHHDPERVALFQQLSKCLLPQGIIVAIDPSHYMHRYKKLIISCLKNSYLRKTFREQRNNLSTHHFCSLGEYKKICQKVPDLEIVDYECFAHRLFVKKGLLILKNLLGKRVLKKLMKFPLLRALSTEILVCLRLSEKKSNHRDL